MIDFRVERGWSFDGYRAWIINHTGRETYIAKPIQLEFAKHKECDLLPEPTLQLNGPFAKEFLQEAKKALAGFNALDKENYEVSARIQKAMQDHIDSLKLVVERTVK